MVASELVKNITSLGQIQVRAAVCRDWHATDLKVPKGIEKPLRSSSAARARPTLSEPLDQIDGSQSRQRSGAGAEHALGSDGQVR